MSNADSPSGFKPIRGVGGSASIRTNEYFVSSAFVTAVGIGELCVLVSGYIRTYTADDSNIAGVAVDSIAASTGGSIMIYDDPLQLFENQTDDNNETTRVGHEGACFKPKMGGTINSTTLKSKTEIDGNTAGAWIAGGGSCLQCVEVSPKIENDVAATWTRLVVKIVPQAHIYGRPTPSNNSA